MSDSDSDCDYCDPSLPDGIVNGEIVVTMNGTAPEFWHRYVASKSLELKKILTLLSMYAGNWRPAEGEGGFIELTVVGESDVEVTLEVHLQFKNLDKSQWTGVRDLILEMERLLLADKVDAIKMVKPSFMTTP